jgi:hypothetical protein
MKTINLILIALLPCACASSLLAQRSSPKTALEAFYKFDRSHSQTFNRSNINARKQWFSSELYSLLLNELKRDAAYLKKNPTDKPFFGDGLPFQPLQEKCEAGKYRALIIKQDFLKGDRAVELAGFAYPKPCKQPDPVVYTIGMFKLGGKWVIDDINYGEDTTLKQRLQRKEY